MTEEKQLDIDFGIDELQMYYGEDYKINDYLTIKQPTIGQVIEFGEKNMYASILPFTCNTTSYRLQLWDMGVDWNDITDFELFAMLIQGMDIKNTKLIFGDVDFSRFKPFEKISEEVDENGEHKKSLVLVHQDYPDFIIDEILYLHIREYIRLMFDQHPKVEHAKGQATKEFIIDEEREKLEIESKKNEGRRHKSILLPLISAMLNHPGFKYKKDELKQCGYMEFMDSIKRLQTYESVRALMSGIYSGMLDTSSMDLNKELNWMRDLYE